MSEGKFYIAFDLAHKPRGKIDENYNELRDHLNENGFICYNFLETPITQDTLRVYDILVFICPDFAKISRQEIMEIVNWVKEDGGGLLLLNHAGGDKGRSSNLDELSENFGISFEGDQVLDEINNLGLENLPVVTAANFIPPHPITNDINEICYRAGCSLVVMGSSISIVSSNETSEPFSCPLIVASEPENGRVCAVGSYEMFRDRTGGGFQHEDHLQLALNIFKWLISDYRMEVTKQGTDHTIPVPVKTTMPQFTSPVAPSFQKQSVSQIDSTVKFSSKSELIDLLETYLNQINTIKNNIEYIIKVMTKSKDETIEQTIEVFQEYAQHFSTLPPEPPESLKKLAKDQSSSDEVFIGLEPVEHRKVDTIEKTFLSNSTEVNQSSESISETATTKEIEEHEINEESLKSEIESLESKVNSIYNLISFIEKKHDSGKLDDKSYEKQTKKLEKDLEQTKSRIEEIKKILG